jgi:hypothetical protein
MSGLVAVLALGTSGCGGISARKTVSPLDFIMPGILRNDTPGCTNALATVVETPAIEIVSGR